MKLIKINLICIGILLIAALASYLLIDDIVFFALLKRQSSVCNNGWVNSFRQLGKVWTPVWLLLIWLLTTRQVKPVLVALIALPLVIPFVYPSKYIVARPRPEFRAEVMQAPDHEHTFIREWSSFPSGDTASVVALAVALTPYLAASGRYAKIALPSMYSIASLIGLLRILAMKHYLSDVFVGAAIGVAAGTLAWLIVEKHPNLRPHIYTTRTARIINAVLIFALPFIAATERVNSLTLFLVRFWPVVIIFVIYACIYNYKPKSTLTC